VVKPEDLRKSLTPRTRMIILNNPSNPSGVVWDPELLREVAELAVERDLIVISDEIYEHLTYDGAVVQSIASFSPDIQSRTMVINGVSKTFSMTGWRIGYAAGPKDAIQAMERLQDHCTSNPVSISQKAALAALRCDSALVSEMVSIFDHRRKLMVQSLTSIPQVTFPVPRGAFYVFANFSPYLGYQYQGQSIDSSMQLAEVLLEKAHIAIVPGSAFGMEGFLRFSYATSEEVIEKGMTRLREFIKELEPL
ncbi:MAG: aminotransferase class I/II-fold pyridoxal phosphate-dependent enzyme, partial [Atribacterota bacterium]